MFEGRMIKVLMQWAVGNVAREGNTIYNDNLDNDVQYVGKKDNK